jgi:alkylhydroperoxidase family enzyme
MRATGEEPAETTIIGVQPGSMDWSTDLSPAVAAGLEGIIEAVLARVGRACGSGFPPDTNDVPSMKR